MARKNLSNIVMIIFDDNSVEFYSSEEGLRSEITNGIIQLEEVAKILLIDVKDEIVVEKIIKTDSVEKSLYWDIKLSDWLLQFRK
jgi:hypothetical protein